MIFLVDTNDFESNFKVLDIPHSLFGCLWFLKSAFLCSVLYWIGAKMIPNKQWIGLIGTLLISQLINIFSFRYMYPSFLLGVYLRNNYQLFQQYRNIITLVSGSVWIILIIFFTSETYKAHWGGYFVSLNPDSTSLLHIYHRLVTGLCGAVFFIGLFEIIFSKITTSIISKSSQFGQYTLGIYILQSIILETILSKIIPYRTIEKVLFDMLVAPIASMGMLFLCLYIIKLVKINRIGRIALLGERIK